MRLLISILGTLLFCGGVGATAAYLGTGEPSDPDAALAPAEAAPGPSLPLMTPPASVLSAAEKALPGMAPLVTPDGIRRKLLVHESGVALFDRPGGDPLGRPAPYWQPLYIFQQRSVDKRRWYRVGLNPRESTILGWVSSDFAVEWDHRVGAAQPPLTEGLRTAPLLVYETKEAWMQILQSGDTEHEPIARAMPTDRSYRMPWPIAESERVVVGGKSYELSRLLFLGEFSEQGPVLDEHPPAYTPEELNAVAADLRQLDVKFVVDNTASTAPFLQAIRKVIQNITNTLAGMEGVDLATGLVLYRDYVDEIMYASPAGPAVTYTFPLTTDIAAFLELVAPLREAAMDSVDAPEAAYDGLHQALSATDWRGHLSERVVVWIGDNSAHPLGHSKNPNDLSGPSLVQLANRRDTHATVFAICIEGGGTEEEQALHLRQCAYVAEETGGAVYGLEGAGPLVARIQEILLTRKAHVECRVEIFQAAVEGSLDERLAKQELDPREVTQCFEFLREFGDVDFERIGPGRPVLGSGWVLTESEGSPTLAKKVYVARSELHFLIHELFGLTGSLNPESMHGLVGASVTARAGEYFKEQRPETMDVFLRARGVHSSARSLLKKSRADIEHMSEEDRRILFEVIDRQYIPGLINARNNNDVFPVNVSGLHFGWILESLLP